MESVPQGNHPVINVSRAMRQDSKLSLDAVRSLQTNVMLGICPVDTDKGGKFARQIEV